MGLFQRLNALVLSRIRERSGEVTVLKVGVAGRQLVLTLSNGTQQSIDLQRLGRVVAVMHETYAGKEVALELADPPQILQIAESCPGWQDVCAALDSVPGSTPMHRGTRACWRMPAMSSLSSSRDELPEVARAFEARASQHKFLSYRFRSSESTAASTSSAPYRFAGRNDHGCLREHRRRTDL